VGQFQNQELFYTISVIDEAIEKGRKVKFAYKEYGTDKRLKNRITKNNKTKKYLVNPYCMVATNGRYYLICNYDRYDGISYYRIDRIANIELTEAKAKPVRSIKGCENGLNLPQHMAEHIYMLSGESQMVIFKAKKNIVTDIIDWFGSDVRFSDETEEDVTARVSVNVNAMKYWAMQYANYVQVVSPQSLVDEIRGDLKDALARYE
jgi:predicted DNA-binding transcriptional regulator YafY